MKTPKKVHERKQKSYTCIYPNCGNTFTSKYNAAKYCSKHRTKEFKNEIYHKIDLNGIKENILLNNQIIKHKFINNQILIYNCECCKEQFLIKIFPGTFIYPKYCPKHRNEFKRKIYHKK